MHLRQPLAGAHHACRVDGLVGGDEDERLDPERDRELRELARAGGVVLHRLARLALHHVHVLVGRSVEDDCRPVAGENRLHAGGVEDVGHQRDDGRGVALAVQLALDREERPLGLLDQQHPLRPVAAELAAELAADAAAGAGDEHALAGDKLADVFALQVHGRPAEEVLDLHRADLRHLHAPRRELRERGHDLDLESFGREELVDLLHALHGSRRHREHRGLHLVVLAPAGDLLGRAEHLDAVHVPTVLAPIVVEEEYRTEPERRARLRLLHELRARVARAENHDVARLARGVPAGLGREPFPVDAEAEAQRAQGADREDEVDQDHAAGRDVPGREADAQEVGGEVRHRHRGRDAHQVRHAEVGQQASKLPKQKQSA